MAVNVADNRYGVAQLIVAPTYAEGANYITIASALTAASSGQTIFLRPGTYTENITLKAGVNITAFNDGLTPNVTIVGTCTMTTAGTVTLSGIRLQTNSAALLAVTGSAASIVNLVDCYLNITDNTAITFSSTSASASINLFRCTGNIGALGIAIFAHSSNGLLTFNYSNITNTGASTTSNTVSGTNSGLRLYYTLIANPITSSGTTATFLIDYSTVDCSALNTSAVIHGSTVGTASSILQARILSGTATAITIAASATLVIDRSEINSSNTAVISGAGTILYVDLSFPSSSSNITVTTQTLYNTGPSMSVGSSNSGATNTLTVTNSANAATSAALLNITVGGTSSADAFTTYTVAGTTNWSVGTDNSVTGDPFVIAASTALGTTNIMSAATTGEINYPLQPSFMAFLSGTINNVTGDNTAYNIICDTEAFDQGGDYDNSTGVFTAPVTGRDSCNCGFRFSGLTTAMTIQDNRVVTSNRSFSTNPAAPSKVFDANTNCSNPYCALMDMDAADTAYMQSTITNGTKVADIGGNATEPRTFFSVYLQA